MSGNLALKLGEAVHNKQDSSVDTEAEAKPTPLIDLVDICDPASFRVGQCIMDGEHSLWADQAEIVMDRIEEVADTNIDTAAELLEQDNSVFQLCRFGQGKRVFYVLQDMDSTQQAKAMAAYEGLFGLLKDNDHYGLFQDNVSIVQTMEMFDRMPIEDQDLVLNNMPDTPVAARNKNLINNARENLMPSLDID